MSINNIELISRNTSNKANMFLMSTAASTESISQSLRDKVRYNSHEKSPRILVFEDAWTKFTRRSDVSYKEKYMQRVIGKGEKIWSKSWLKYILGRNAVISTVNSSRIDRITLKYALEAYDSILMPGGNTFQLMRGLRKNADIIRDRVNEGSHLYIGESAGAVISGISSYPALIKPGDICPVNAYPEKSLGLLNAEVIVHAEGHKMDNQVPILGKIANIAVKSCTSQIEDIIDFTKTYRNHGRPALVLNDGQAADITNGKLTIIG
jgi:Peptidase family S51